MLFRSLVEIEALLAETHGTGAERVEYCIACHFAAETHDFRVAPALADARRSLRLRLHHIAARYETRAVRVRRPVRKPPTGRSCRPMAKPRQLGPDVIVRIRVGGHAPGHR